MKKRLNLFALVLLFINSLGLHGQSDNQHFILTGEIKHTDADEVVLTYITFQVDRTVRNIDTCHISNGIFTKEGNLSEPTEVSLTYCQGKTISFYIEPGDLHLTLNGENDEFILTGSKTQEDYLRMNAQTKSLQDSMQSIYLIINDLREKKNNVKDTAILMKMDEELEMIFFLRDSLRKEKEKVHIDFIRSNPDSYAALDAFLPAFQGWDLLPLTDFRQLYDSFSSRLKNTARGKWTDNAIKREENTIIGAIAPDFISNDLEGRLVKLSDFRGDYVLLDFWATWCPPCMRSFPYIEKLYAKYAPQGLQFIAISCDNKEDRWRSRAKKLGNDWYNIAFVNNYQDYDQGVVNYNDIQLKYPCTGIPKFFIIDPSGIVIGYWFGYDSSTETGINELLEKVFLSGKLETVELPTPAKKGKLYRLIRFVTLNVYKYLQMIYF